MKYKLTYWDVRGRAEPIRIIFAAAQVDFVDNRISKGDSWAALKPSMPWNQVPILEVDGKCLAQSVTICRYLARLFHLVGSSEWDSAKCDEYVDVVTDLYSDMKKIVHEQDPNLKSKFKMTFIQEVLPRVLKKFEKLLEDRKTIFLVCETVTWADIFVSCSLERLENTAYAGPSLLEEYPKLKQLKRATYEHPGIKEWIENRPQE